MMTRWGHLPRALKLADERVVDYLPPLYTCTGMLYSPRMRRLAALGFVLWRQSRPEPFPLSGNAVVALLGLEPECGHPLLYLMGGVLEIAVRGSAGVATTYKYRGPWPAGHKLGQGGHRKKRAADQAAGNVRELPCGCVVVRDHPGGGWQVDRACAVLVTHYHGLLDSETLDPPEHRRVPQPPWKQELAP